MTSLTRSKGARFLLAGTGLAVLLAATAPSAHAQYYRGQPYRYNNYHYGYGPGPAIAGALLGLGVGAAIAGAYAPRYYAPPPVYYAPPPVYYTAPPAYGYYGY